MTDQHRDDPAHAAEDDEREESRFRDLVEGLDAIVWEAHPHSLRFTFVSPQAEAMVGYPPPQWRDESDFWLRVIHPEDRDRARRHRREAVAAGRNHVIEYRVVRPNGSIIWLRDVAHPVHKDGAVVRLRGVMVDITARRRAEQRLEAQYAVAALLAAADSLEAVAPQILERICRSVEFDVGGLWTVDAERDVVRNVAVWQPPGRLASGFVELSRRTTFARGDGLPGRVWSSGEPAWILDVTRDPNFPRGRIAAAEGIHAAFAFPIALRGEVLGVLEFFSSSILTPDPALLRAMETLGAQIGQFVERTRAEAGFRAELVRKSSVLDAALDCIVTMDHAGVITEFNAAAERTFGFRRDEVIGRPMSDVIIPPRFRDAHRAGLARYLATGEHHVLGRRIEVEALRADGSELPVELAITRIPLPGPPTFTGFMRDITERRRNEKAIQDMTEELETANEELRQINEELIAQTTATEASLAEAERANRAKAEFLAMMSHELRTPLNAIGGYTQLLELGVRGPISEQQRDDLVRIRRSQQHLLSMINDVLNFARLEAGHIEYHPADVPLDETLLDLRVLVQPQLEAKSLHYTYHGGDPSVTVYADKDKLLQILLNLLFNAAKYTQPGGSIDLRWAVDGERVRIDVRDTGIGIPEDKLEAVFEPFIQVEPALTRQRDGVGLGLAISRDLARGMHGDLTVRSTVGEGSTFTLTLRRAAPSAAWTIPTHSSRPSTP